MGRAWRLSDRAIVTGPSGLEKERRTARNIGVGCFTAFTGAVSCAMTAVFIGKFVDFFQRNRPPEGVPVQGWYWYALFGAVFGFITLPTIVLWRLRRSDGIADGKAKDKSADQANRNAESQPKRG